MPIIPIRALGQHGIITDISPFDLPANAWTSGRNVRFDASLLKKAAIFRGASTDASLSDAVHCLRINESTDYDSLIVPDSEGYLWKYSAGAWSDVTPTSSYTPAASTSTWTSTILSQVAYCNRDAEVPVAFLPGATEFAALANWDAGWRCVSLRAFKDVLVAFNITKGSTSYPNMVKWSDYALAGAVPASWDETDPTTAAGENTIGDLASPLIDGLQLRDTMIVYSEDQVWRMEFMPGNSLIFDFRKLFSDGGILAANCAVEVEGMHCVFGTKEIYFHDGATPQFPARNKVNDYIYRRINFSRRHVCFVHYNPRLKEVFFCYNTTSDEVAFPDATYCNEAAVYNIAAASWSFQDLPNVAYADRMNLDTVLTYASATTAAYTYDGFGGTYAEQADTAKRHSVWISRALGSSLTADRLLAQDDIDEGLVAGPIVAETQVPSWVTRIGLDFDQFLSPASGTSIRNKLVTCCYPQARTLSILDTSMDIAFGGHDYPNSDGAVTWEDASSFNPATDEKVDSRMYGRYLAIHIDLPDDHDMHVASLDLVATPISNR